jgi:hypothetical protein
MHEMKAEVRTNQDVLKHKRLKFLGTPDKEQDKALVNQMKNLVSVHQERWDVQD